MSEALKAIALTDDVSIVRAAEYFHETLSRALHSSKLTQIELTDLAKASTEIRDLFDVATTRGGQTLDSMESVEAARQLLVTAAQDPSLTDTVAHCIANWPDDRLSVGKVLGIGTIVGLLLLIATTEMEYKNGPVHIHKKTIIPEEAKIAASILRMKIEASVTVNKGADLDSRTPK